MRRYLIENIGLDIDKEQLLSVEESELSGGVYTQDRDYIEVGEITSVNDYEEGLRVLVLETGERVAEVRVKHRKGWGQLRYLPMYIESLEDKETGK